MARPTLRKGSTGQDVKDLQDLLSIRGYKTSADGKFGPATETHVIAFQKAKGLTADGIVGAKTWAALQPPTSLNTKARPEQLLQFDSRWKEIPYTIVPGSGQTIGSSGCGPTSFAIIHRYFKDKSYTPVQACKRAVELGHRTEDSGTNRKFFLDIGKEFGYNVNLSTVVSDSAVQNMARLLTEPNILVVASMGPGQFTNGGHFIVLWNADCANKTIMVCDPGSSKDTRKQGSFNTFVRQSKAFITFRR